MSVMRSWMAMDLAWAEASAGEIVRDLATVWARVAVVRPCGGVKLMVLPAELTIVGMDPKGERQGEAVTLDSLIDSVVDYFSIDRHDVVGTSRSRDLLVPRQVIMYLANTKLRMSLVKIGQALGNRNHTTVMHGVSRIKEQLKNDRQLLRDVNAITREVGIN